MDQKFFCRVHSSVTTEKLRKLLGRFRPPIKSIRECSETFSSDVSVGNKIVRRQTSMFSEIAIVNAILIHIILDFGMKMEVESQDLSRYISFYSYTSIWY